MRFPVTLGGALAVGLSALALSIAAVQPAGATVLYQSLNSLTGGTFFSIDNSGGGQILYQTFTLTAAATVSEVDFTEFNEGTLGTAQRLAIYADNAGTPGTQLFTQSITPTTTQISGSFGVEQYLTTGLQLSAGTYFVSPNYFFADTFNTAIFSASSGELYYYNGGGVQPAGQSAAFDIIGTAQQAPEPASLTIFGAGLGALGWLRRRR